MDWKAFVVNTKRIAAWTVPLIVVGMWYSTSYRSPAYFLSFLLGLGWLIAVAPWAFRASRRIGRGVAVETVQGAMGSRKLVIAAKTGVAKWGRGVVDEAKRRAEKGGTKEQRKVTAPTRRPSSTVREPAAVAVSTIKQTRISAWTIAAWVLAMLQGLGMIGSAYDDNIVGYTPVSFGSLRSIVGTAGEFIGSNLLGELGVILGLVAMIRHRSIGGLVASLVCLLLLGVSLAILLLIGR